MNFKTLLDRSMEKLKTMGHGALVRKLSYAADLAELHSVLREYVFYTDAKVNAFLRSVEEEANGQASTVVNQMLGQPAKKCPNCGYELKESHVCRR